VANHSSLSIFALRELWPLFYIFLSFSLLPRVLFGVLSSIWRNLDWRNKEVFFDIFHFGKHVLGEREREKKFVQDTPWSWDGSAFSGSFLFLFSLDTFGWAFFAYL